MDAVQNVYHFSAIDIETSAARGTRAARNRDKESTCIYIRMLEKESRNLKGNMEHRMESAFCLLDCVSAFKKEVSYNIVVKHKLHQFPWFIQEYPLYILMISGTALRKCPLI